MPPSGSWWRRNGVTCYQVVENSCWQAGQKDIRGEAREKSTRVGVLRRNVGATPLGAGMTPAAIERNYPKRLLKVGWRHMSLFQQPARECEIADPEGLASWITSGNGP